MRLLLTLLALLLFPAQAEARTQRIAASLVVSTEAPKPGTTITLGIRFQPQAGWHGYWSNPGDSGLAPAVDWDAPAGLSFGPLQHPAPTVFRVAGINSFVHAGEHVLLSSVRIPQSIAAGTKFPVKAALNWLACSDTLCVPERATLELELIAGDGAAGNRASVIRRAQAALPRAVTTTGHYTLDEGKLRFALPAGISLDPSRGRFFPDSNGILDASTTRPLGARGQELTVTALGNTPSTISGVLSDGRRAYRVKFARAALVTSESPTDGNALALPPFVQEGADAVASLGPSPASALVEDDIDAGSTAGGLSATVAGRTEAVPATSILLVMLGALAGGLLLNLMPCVFPILSLKALSLARAGGSERDARKDGLGYTAGAVLVTGLLGLVIVAMRQAGVELGWSFQLQNPAVILFLLLLTLGVALNLAGLFELPALSVDRRVGEGGASGSFATGALAAFIATPCSGPFMATALGAAMLLPAAGALLVFLSLGLGLALPFLIMAFFPPVRRLLPKPGPWMAIFRRVLAIPLLLTAVGLLWLLGRQGGTHAMTVGTVLGLFLGIGLWWVGLRQHGGRVRTWLPLAPTAAAIALVSMTAPPTTMAIGAPVRTEGMERFSEKRLVDLSRAGVPVFVDFTADWCLTCKVNEQVAINRKATQAAFRRAGVVTLVGDWTNGDPEITRFLSQNGRNSIPFYLFVRPHELPEVLPQLLTSTMLIDRARAAVT